MRKVIVHHRTCDTCSAFLKLPNRATGCRVYLNASLLCPSPEEGAQVPKQAELICSRGYLLLKRSTSGYLSPAFPQPQVTDLLF